MNIGILTFHMAHNFGAMLQAYALSYTVNQMADCSCEIIDYRLPEIYEKYNNMLKKSHVMPKHLKFEDFMNKDLPLSNRLEDPQMANQYSAYILGCCFQFMHTVFLMQQAQDLMSEIGELWQKKYLE